MTKHIYIAGKISGEQNFKEIFDEADMLLTNKGYHVINPTRLPHKNENDWILCMRLDIISMVKYCDKICILSHSKGAVLEITIACALGFAMGTLNDWLSSPCSDSKTDQSLDFS